MSFKCCDCCAKGVDPEMHEAEGRDWHEIACTTCAGRYCTTEELAEIQRKAGEEAWEQGQQAGVKNQIDWDGWRYSAGMPIENPYRSPGGGAR